MRLNSRWTPGVLAAAWLLATIEAGAGRAHAAGVPAGPLAVVAVGQQGFGTVKGKLVWGGGDIPPVATLVDKGKSDKDPDICARDAAIKSRALVIDEKTGGVSYGLAFIQRPKGKNPEAVKALLDRSPKVEIDQVNCEFKPYLTAIHADQKLVLKSSDPKSHNVRFAGFNNTGLNTTIAPGGSFETKLVSERLPMKLSCDIHPWMSGWIMVFDHPFFAVTRSDGTFEIKGIPAGKQNLVVWQETVGYATPGAGRGMAITVTADETTDVGEVKLIPKKK